MPTQVKLSLVIELVLITLTVVLLVQPVGVFKASPSGGVIKKGWAQASTYAGLVLLCVTFCWSVIFGIVLVINEITFKI